MALPTLVQVAKFGPHVRTELIDEAIKFCPEVNGTIGFKRVPGYTYSTLVKTADPVVSFRDANEGMTATSSTYENRVITTKILNPRWECDKAVALACIDGADYYIAREALAQMQGAFYTFAKQLWYGTSNDAKGFAGLQSQVDSSMLTDAGGTSDNTASSVYIVAAGQVDYLSLVLGGDGSFEISPVVEQSIFDDSYKRFQAYVQDGVFWVGAQLGHAKAVARICNLTADSGKGLTDDLIYEALEKFPVSVRPTAMFMSRRSLGQLRNSRTATNATGAPAPIPTEVAGVPIYATEAIVNTEALEVIGSS